MTAEVAGIIGIVVVQIAMFAQMIVTNRVKARESHVLSIEQGFTREQKRQDEDASRLREEVHDLRDKLERLEDVEKKCQLENMELRTRLLLLERFRNVAAADSPTGKTKEAMPPPLEK